MTENGSAFEDNTPAKDKPSSPPGNPNSRNHTWPEKPRDWLLIATLVIAASAILATLASIATAVISGVYYQKQVTEMQRATKLEWRPYLDLEYTDREFSSYYLFNVKGTDSLMAVTTDQIATSDSALRKANSLLFKQNFRVKYYNRGRTPLRIKSHSKGMLTSEQWSDVYHKSNDILLDSVAVQSKDSKLNMDYVVPADTSVLSSNINSLYLPILEGHLDLASIPKEIVVYIYSFVEYEDYFGNEYNLLRIEYNVYLQSIDGERLHFEYSKTGIERHRWDIDI